jgi:hypothetical protein
MSSRTPDGARLGGPFAPSGQAYFPAWLQKGVSMRVVVTGGAGFIGSHLCDSLTKNGRQLSVLITSRLDGSAIESTTRTNPGESRSRSGDFEQYLDDGR